MMEYILSDSEPASESESMLGVFTASERNVWAHARETHFSGNNINKASLDIIERSTFILILEEQPFTANEVKYSTKS